ncbi:MAG: hypothetical protein PF518_01800 [Spirochaetaceae bacterium]|nr:hypothetical protein [Spirochaetaceae bacterium]
MKKIVISIISLLLIFSCENGLIGLGERIDIDLPVITIGQYLNGRSIVDGDYVKGTIVLTGSVSDDIGVSAVNITIVDTVTSIVVTGSAAIDYSAMTWSYSIDTTSFIDGEKDITIEVLDTSSTPKSSSEQRLLFFDNTSPIVLVTVSPGFSSTASDSEFSIKGEVSDPFRVKSVVVELLEGSGVLSAVEGVNTWSCVLSNAVTGTYRLKITAEDYAGNQNSHFYHYTDVKALNGGSLVTVENLYKIENGEDVTGIIVTDSSLETIELIELPLSVDMNDDVPVITISNPEANAQLGGNAIVIGRVEDDDEVDISTLKINVNDSGWVWNSALPDTEITGSGSVINFKYDISSLGNGVHTIQIRAEDDHGTLKTSDQVSFTIDLGAPQIEISSPSQGDYSNLAIVPLIGTSYDDQSVFSVQVQLDGEAEVNWRDASTSNGFNDWSYTTPSLSEGMHNVKVYAEDGTGKTSSYNISFYVDVTDPTVAFDYPAKSSEVYGDIIIQGRCEDNSNTFTDGYIKIGKNGSWEVVSNLSHWTKSLSNLETTYTNSASSNDLGGGLWELPVTFKITDFAGNSYESTESDYYFHINGSLDNPEVSITYPENGFKTGGPVTIRGTSYDEQQVSRVEMRLDLNGDGDYLDQLILDGDGNTSDPFEDETVWQTVSGLGVLNWQQELNTSGELFGLSAGGIVNIQVRAIDTKDGGTTDGVIGDTQTISITFDNSYPYFDNLSHASYDYESGTFTLSAQAHDTEFIDQILISYNGGTSYTDITSSSTKINNMQYNISLSINSSSYISDSGILPIKLKVVDNANNSTDTAINLNIDNIIPTGYLTGTPDDINGTNFKIQGTATDSGTVSGIDKIEVYFIRSGSVYDPGSSNVSTAVGTTDFNDGNGSVPYINDPNYKITIDDKNELGNDSGGNGDLDDYNESLTLSGSTFSWWAEFDSNNIPDGLLKIHYVVFDMAGNAQHYEGDGFIKNNKPVITSTTVGVDLDYSGSVDPAEEFVYSGSFNSQNRLYISLQVSDDNVPGLDYGIYHGFDDTGTLLSSTSSYTIDISSGYSDGSTTFFCKITDSDGIIVSQLIETVIDNTDDIAPTISVDEITQSNVPNGHLEAAGDSLYNNTPTADADVSGEVRLTGNAWDNQRIKNITLSLDGIGTDHVLASWVGNTLVVQDGDFTIDSLSMSEYSGLQVTWTYIWDTTTVPGYAGNDVQISLNIEDFGSPSNSATDIMQVDVVPYLTRINTSITDSFSDAFSRSSTGKYPVSINSNDSTYETITVYGYNLNPVAIGSLSDIRLSLDPDGIDGVTKKGIGLSYSNLSTDKTQVDVNLELGTGGVATGNGYLNIFTNGIPSINNINDNSVNSESDYINPNLSDDRYLSLWDLRLLRNEFTLANNAVFPRMSMNGNTPEFSYENNSQGWGIALYLDGTTEKKIYENWDLFTFTAIDHNSSGDQSLIYDINVVNGNNGIYNSGNYGGILTSYFYDVPGTSWNYWSYRFNDNQVWLENLVDEDSVTTAVLDRYQFPDIYTVGTTSNTSVYYSVYDKLKDKIIFRTYNVGTDNSIDNITGGQINNSGTALYTSIPQHEADGTGTFPEYDDSDFRFANSNQAGKTPTGQHLIDDTYTSQYTAVAATSDGSTAVVAYYDATGTGKIRLKYNNTPTSSASWVDLGVIDSGYGGEYIDMAIDSTDNIHIAYYDNNNGDLRYIYIPVTSFSSGTFGTTQKILVDGYFDVGEKLTLELNSSDIPYIAYKGVNRSGKVAWLNGTLSNGTDSSNQFTGSWEIMIIPAEINNTDSNRYNIGVGTNDLPVLGYTNGGLEYIMLLSDLSD